MHNSLRILWTHLGGLALTFLPGPARAYGPGCPHPAAEPAVLPATTALLNASMKWCGIAEAPGIANPALVCEPSFRDYMWRRHERASDRIWIPQCRITLRSGAAGISHLNYKMFGDLDTTIGMPGDIVVSPITEMDNTWLQCDMAWNTPTPQPKGVIAVSARRLINAAGAEVARGIAYQGSITQPWLAVADASLPSMCQLNERSLAHEFGHVLGLGHVTTAGNLMQSGGSGATLTMAQCNQARTYLQANTILDPPGAVAGNPPVNRVAFVFDDPGDPAAEQPFLDILKIAAIDDSPTQRDLMLCLGTRGLIPPGTSNLHYWILLDTDNDANTGGTPADLVPGQPMGGVEFVCEVARDGTNTTATLYELGEFGLYVPVLLPPGRLAAASRDINLIVCDPLPAYQGPAVIPRFSEIDFVITHQGLIDAGIIPGGIAAANAGENEGAFPKGLRLQAVGALADTRRFDMAPEAGRSVELPKIEFPEAILPPFAQRGQMVPVLARRMPPHTQLKLMFGPTMLPVHAFTDDGGLAQFQFQVPLEAAAGPALITIGPLDPNNASTADAVIDIQVEVLPIDLTAGSLQLHPVGPEIYEVTPLVDVEGRGALTVPVDWDLFVNNILVARKTNHILTVVPCPPPPCPDTECQIIVESMGMREAHTFPCVDLGFACTCQGRIKLWPLANVPIPPGAEVRLVIDPMNRVTEENEANNTFVTTVAPPSRIDLAAAGLELTAAGDGTYHVTPAVEVGGEADAPVPADWSLAVNGTLVAIKTNHVITIVPCPPPPCPDTECQIIVDSMGMVETNTFPCVDLGLACVCRGRVKLWPLERVPIPPGAEVTLEIDPLNRVTEQNEANNTFTTRTPAAAIDLAASGLEFRTAGPGTYDVTPVLSGRADVAAEVPGDWDLLVNGTLVARKTNHVLRFVPCPPPPCPDTECQVIVTSMGMVETNRFPCIDLTEACVCFWKVRLWPLPGAAIPPNTEVTLVVDPLNRVQETDEGNNIFTTRLPQSPRLANIRLNRETGEVEFEVPTEDGVLYQVQATARLNPPILWTPLFAFTGDGTSLTVNVPWDPAGNRFFQVLANALPTVNLACGDNRRIYRNLTGKDVTITIQATDACKPFSSELTIRNERDETVETARIDDGTTETVTVTVPKKGSVYFDCSGSEGKCQYTISP